MVEFTELIVALKAALGVGASIAFLLQVFKLFFPQVFSDGTMENWRLLFVVICALFLFFAPQLGLAVEFIEFDAAAQAFADLGAIVMPLFIWLADWIGKTFYKGVLRGRMWIGKSYSLGAG